MNFTGDSSFIYRTGGAFNTSQLNYSIQTNVKLYITRRTPVSSYRTLDVYGSIVCDTFKITGNGTFNLHDYASIYIASDSGINILGIKGNITTRSRIFSSLAKYIYNGRNNQYTGNALPNIVYGLKLNLISPTKKLVIKYNIQVTDSLDLQSGVIESNNFLVTLGINTVNLGNLKQSNGYINGSFARYLAPSINSGISGLFPIGISTDYRPIQLEFTTAPVTGGLVKGTYLSMDTGDAGLVISDAGVDLLDASSTGYWKMEIVNGDFRNGVYKGTIYPNNYPDITDPNMIHLISRSRGGSWTLDGTHKPSTGTITNPIVSRNGMTKIADIGLSASNFTSLP